MGIAMKYPEKESMLFCPVRGFEKCSVHCVWYVPAQDELLPGTCAVVVLTRHIAELNVDGIATHNVS